MVRLNHHQRDPIDVFGRAFGRDVTALMAAIGCMAKEEIYYSEHKNLEAAFGRVTATIIGLPIGIAGVAEPPGVPATAHVSLPIEAPLRKGPPLPCKPAFQVTNKEKTLRAPPRWWR